MENYRRGDRIFLFGDSLLCVVIFIQSGQAFLVVLTKCERWLE